MLKEIGEFGKKWRLASLLALVIMLPAIFFSAYEFSTLTRSEALIADVYRQQLDVVLFSINQYAWDVVNSWANTISDALKSRASAQKDDPSIFTSFLNENAGIRCLFVADSQVAGSRVFYPRLVTAAGEDITAHDIRKSLKNEIDVVERLFRFQATGYRKIEPLIIEDNGGQKSLALVFVSSRRTGSTIIVGLVLDAQRFIREVLGQKMDEAAGDNFLLSVNRKGSEQVIYAAGEVTHGEARQTKDLWLFPDYTIGIRLRAETIEEAVRSRFYRNLALIGLLNAVLIAGVWVVYRTVRSEVELAQMKSDFVSNVTHEIKTPLSLIRMFGETLQMKRVRSEKRKQEYYDTIVQESERLTRLIDNILNFSRMEAGKKEYRFAPADLNDIVGNVLKSYRLHLENQGFTVVTEMANQLPTIRADVEALSEALLNIIDNSVKYSLEKKRLTVRTGLEQGMTYVDVEDEGIGIDPKQQKKIFEKFYRVSSGLVHTTKGSGLGLSLVKHIVDAHKGMISLQSEPGKGSTFRISLPRVHQ